MAGGDQDKPFRLGDIFVEPAFHRLSRRGRSVAVEPKVMRVLLCLTARRGQVVRHQQIRSEVWGGVHVVDGVLARAAYQLRRATAQLGGSAIEIETLRQVGYRLTVADSYPNPAWNLGLGLRHLASPKIAWLAAFLSLTFSLQMALTRQDDMPRSMPAAPFASERVTEAEPAAALPEASRSVAAAVADRSHEVAAAPAIERFATTAGETDREIPRLAEGRFFEVGRIAPATPALRPEQPSADLQVEVEERRTRLRSEVRARRTALLADLASRSGRAGASRPRSDPSAPAAPPPPAAPAPPEASPAPQPARMMI